MINIVMRSKTIVAATLATTFFLLASSALAIGPFNQLPRSFSGNRSSESGRPPQATEAGQHRGEGQLRACQARQQAVQNRMKHMLQRAQKMMERFDAIAERTKLFYQNKVLPSGKTVANYDALVADIATKKVAVGVALDNAKTAADSFNCDSGNPKEQMINFRDKMQQVIRSLHDYRRSVRNLIVAVHSVVGEENKSATTSAGSRGGGK